MKFLLRRSDSAGLDAADGGEWDEAASTPGAGATDGVPEQDQDTGREPTHAGEETTWGESVATAGTARTEGASPDNWSLFAHFILPFLTEVSLCRALLEHRT